MVQVHVGITGVFVFVWFMVASFLDVVVASDNGLALLPPMGWNTWCTAGQCGRDYCDEAEIKSVAEAMVNSGMKDLGYTYINMDDCWADGRDAQGNIYADPSRFPSGMKALADFLHGLGLKFGLYTDAGLQTCSSGGRNHSIPGSYGHYVQDAKTYASWGMDFVKMDWCNTKVDGKQLDPRVQYPEMSKALNESGRPILFSMCEWGLDDPWQWARPWGNMWRMHGDHHDNWNSTSSIIEAAATLGQFAGRGGWNDPDFLMTGGEGCRKDTTKICPGMSQTEYVTEFSIWSIINAPMLIATEIRNMGSKKKTIVLNKEVIAINQDALAVAGGRVGISDGNQDCQIWSKPLSNGDKAILLYNADTISHSITVEFSVVGWSSATVALRDLWQHQDLGHFTNSFTTEVEPHGVVFVRATKQ